MTYYALKIVVSVALVVAISEIAKRSSVLGGFLASLPLVSILALIWLYVDTRSLDRVAALSYSVFWLVLPSLSFFVLLPWLLRRTENFYLSLAASVGVMLLLYFLMILTLKRFNIDL